MQTKLNESDAKMSNSRNNFQFFNNPLAIRQEIQRFESVHPSIYAIYDLIELIPDQQIAQQIRDHVVCIEGKSKILYIEIFTIHFCSFHVSFFFSISIWNAIRHYSAIVKCQIDKKLKCQNESSRMLKMWNKIKSPTRDIL